MTANKKTVRIELQALKQTVSWGFITACMVFLNTNIFAQTNQWKTAKLDNGKIIVQYNISTRINENGKRVPLIEDSATTTDTLTMQKCIMLMKDVSKHKEFNGDRVSEKVKTISDHEWIVYYYSNNPWPIADSDCVAKMTFSENTTDKTAVFTSVAAPDEFEKRKVRRMTYYNVTCTFKDLGDGNVEITITAKTSPVKVPRLLIRSAFPEAPAEALRKIVKLAKKM